jgi:spore maturation protein SpmB
MGPMWAKAVAVAQPLLEGVGAVLSAVLIPSLQTLFAVSKIGFAAWSGYMSVLFTALKPVADLVGWLLERFAELLTIISSASGALADFVGVSVPASPAAAGTEGPGSAAGTTINANVNVGAIDAADAAKRVAEAVKPGIERAAEDQRRATDAEAARQRVRGGIGG